MFEKLHEAAYKNALSNSLYCPDHMVGRISPNQVWRPCGPDTQSDVGSCGCLSGALNHLSFSFSSYSSSSSSQLQAFVEDNFTSGRMALVGIGERPPAASRSRTVLITC